MASSAYPKKKATRSKTPWRLSSSASVLAATLLSAWFSFAVTHSSSYANTEKQVVHILLSPFPDTRAKQLEDLGPLDVLGIDTSHGIVDVRVSGAEIAFLHARGFELSFAPPDSSGPKALNIDEYLTPDKLASKLESLEAEHPNLLRVWSIGRTHEGRDILAAEVTVQSEKKGNTANKPAALFNAMHHARELMTTEVAVDIIETLVAEFDSDLNTRRLLEDFRVVVVPQVNPDGNARVHAWSRYWRKNAWSKNGRVVGVDLNRNYPALWNACKGSSGSESSDSYRGPAPASEPETQAMMALVRSIKPMVNISYHAYGELIIHPFGCRSKKNPSQAMFASIGAQMKAALVSDEGRKNTYAVGTAPDVIYPADGTDVDWQWKEEGVVSFAIEVGSSRQGFQPEYARWRDVAVANQRGGWKALLGAMVKGTVVVQPSTLTAPVTASVRTLVEPGVFAPFDSEASDNERTFSLRRTEAGYAFLLPAGTHKITFRDAQGRAETQQVVVDAPEPQPERGFPTQTE